MSYALPADALRFTISSYSPSSARTFRDELHEALRAVEAALDATMDATRSAEQTDAPRPRL